MRFGEICRRCAHWVSLVGITLQLYVLLILLPFAWFRASELGLADDIFGWDRPHGPWKRSELDGYLGQVFIWSLMSTALMLLSLLLDRGFWRLVGFALSAAIVWGLLATHFWLID